MPLSYTRLTADGTTDVFTFATPYISDKELTVFVNGVPASFEHLNQGTLRLAGYTQKLCMEGGSSVSFVRSKTKEIRREEEYTRFQC